MNLHFEVAAISRTLTGHGSPTAPIPTVSAPALFGPFKPSWRWRATSRPIQSRTSSSIPPRLMSADSQVTPRHSISTVATALCFMLAVLAVAFCFEAWRQMRFDETALVYEFEGYINYGSPIDPKAIEVFGPPLPSCSQNLVLRNLCFICMDGSAVGHMPRRVFSSTRSSHSMRDPISSSGHCRRSNNSFREDSKQNNNFGIPQNASPPAPWADFI